MSLLKTEDLINILPKDGPSVKEVKKYFKPEFLNRIDDIIIFNSLSMKNLYNIIDLQLQDLRENMIKKGMKLKINQCNNRLIKYHFPFLPITCSIYQLFFSPNLYDCIICFLK